MKVSTKSPESVTKSIVNAYQKGDTEAVKKCFGLDPDKKCAEEITQEIKYNMKQFEAYGASEVNFTKCESLGNFNGYDLVYAIYNLIKKDKDDKKSEALEIPSMSMYFVKEKDKKYHVVPAKDVTDELSKISSEEFSKFMKTDVYKTYGEGLQKVYTGKS